MEILAAFVGVYLVAYIIASIVGKWSSDRFEAKHPERIPFKYATIYDEKE